MLAFNGRYYGLSEFFIGVSKLEVFFKLTWEP